MGVKLEDLLKENTGPLLEDKSKKTINLLLIIIALIIVVIFITIGISMKRATEMAQIERAKNLSTDIDLISAYIKNIYSEYRETGDETLLVGVSQEGKNVNPVVLNVNGHQEEYKYGYYYVTASQIKSMINTLNILNENYVLNYSTGDVVNLVGAKWNGKTYYSVDDLKAIRDGKTPPSDYTIYINSAEDMKYLYEKPNGYFKLSKDIDMSTYSTGDGWKPVEEFSGKFDGRGYVIKNLIISRAAERYCGLFGQVKNGATINNLKLENVNISGGEYTGAIAGACGGNVSNCSVTGKVNSQSSFVGGAFGMFENGVAQNIIVKVSVNGNENVGGFAGSVASGTVQVCSEEGNVTGIKNVGGFVGLLNPTSGITLSQVYSNATIISTENAGGSIGNIIINTGSVNIMDSYAKGQISSCNKVAGGFVGNMITNPGTSLKFSSVYTVADTPILCETRGGFSGSITSRGSNIIDGCFWERDNLLDQELNSIGYTNNAGIEFEYHTPSEMKNTSIFEGWDVTVWKFENGKTPILRWQ